jgi:hypothetical protein
MKSLQHPVLLFQLLYLTHGLLVSHPLPPHTKVTMCEPIRTMLLNDPDDVFENLQLALLSPLLLTEGALEVTC